MSLKVHLGSDCNFGSIFGVGITVVPFDFWDHSGSILGLGVTLGLFES